jgi:hypothetical protein
MRIYGDDALVKALKEKLYATLTSTKNYVCYLNFTSTES